MQKDLIYTRQNIGIKSSAYIGLIMLFEGYPNVFKLQKSSEIRQLCI